MKSIAAYAVAIVSVLAMYSCATKPAKQEVCMIAHRGYSSKYHENTELAFQKAVEHGSGGIETDIRITADGYFVCSHNSDVVFRDSSRLEVATSTLAELTAKPLLNKVGNEEVYLCTFKRYLEICRDNHMVCFIELKGRFPDEKIKECFNLAKEIYDLKMCPPQSDDFGNLTKLKEFFPELDVMFCYAGPEDGDYRRCFDYGFDIDAKWKVLTPEMVKEFHDRGLKVGAWTANDTTALNYCKSLNIEYIESDVY